MSRARTLAQLLGSDGILNVADLAGLAAIASSGSASDLGTGTLPVDRIADGALVAAKLADIAAIAGTYGSSANSKIAKVTVNNKGQITGIVEEALSLGGKKVVITSSQTWTVPAGITQVFATCVGGGGAGGGAGSNYYGGYGGAAGAIALGNITGLTPGQQISLTVGNGGVGSVGAGAAGGASSVGSYLTAGGGAGGIYNTQNNALAAAVGGTASGSALLFGFRGGYGGKGSSGKGGLAGGDGGSINDLVNIVPANGQPSGTGSAQILFFVGVGGLGRYRTWVQGPGGNGTGYGAGGGGAYRTNTSYAGGNGGAGVIILEY